MSKNPRVLIVCYSYPPVLGGSEIEAQRVASARVIVRMLARAGAVLVAMSPPHGPHDPAMPWMTWQGQADYWAASIAMRKIWGPRARGATLRAARELVELHRIFESQLDDDEPDLLADCRYCIWRSGALGQEMPGCAMEAFASISE